MCLAVPGKILSVDDTNPTARTGQVDFSGSVREVNLSSVPDAGVGDYVIVHAGFALNRIDEAEARQVLDYLAQMGEPEEPEGTT